MGTWSHGTAYRAIEADLFACASQFDTINAGIQGGGDDCAWEKSDLEAYLGPAINLFVYHNTQKVMLDEYGEASIKQ